MKSAKYLLPVILPLTCAGAVCSIAVSLWRSLSCTKEKEREKEREREREREREKERDIYIHIFYALHFISMYIASIAAYYLYHAVLACWILFILIITMVLGIRVIRFFRKANDEKHVFRRRDYLLMKVRKKIMKHDNEIKTEININCNKTELNRK